MLGSFHGRPGKGKTLKLVHEAYKKFKKDNPPFKVWFTEHILQRDYIYTLKVYSDFPIFFKGKKFDKNTGDFIPEPKGKVYHFYNENGEIVSSKCISSIPVRLFDFNLTNRFLENSLILIDEIQLKYDSTDYNAFPDSIAHYLQIHRHLDLTVLYSSQSQSRVVKRAAVITEEYNDIKTFRKFFHWAFVRVRRSYEMNANLESNTKSDLVDEVDYFTCIINLKKVGSMYDSKYLRKLLSNTNYYKTHQYHSKLLDRDQLLYMFFPTNEERLVAKETSL